RDLVVLVAFLAQETEHRGHRGQPDLAVAHPCPVQPRLVEVEPRRQHVLDALVQTCHEQASYARVSHGCERAMAPPLISRRSVRLVLLRRLGALRAPRPQCGSTTRTT